LELKKKTALELEDKIKLLKDIHQKRQQRRLKQQTLGDSDSEEDDALSWVQKAKKIREEKALAEKRAMLLAEIEEEEKGSNSEEDPIAFRMEKRKTENNNDDMSTIVDGVTVLHKMDEFQEGETILVLADSKIVEEGKMNEEMDELESISLTENMKTKKYNEIRSGKGYDVYSETQSDILPQYDDDSDIEKKERKWL